MKKATLTVACIGLLLGLGLPAMAAEGDAKKGETVFNDNCAVCHNADSTEAKVGPGLKGLFMHDKLVNGKPVTEENVREVIDKGGATMPPMGDAISAEDKDNLIAYLKAQTGAPAAAAPPAAATAGAAAPAAGDAKKGEMAFNDNCSVCHNADSTEAKVGPGLKGLFMHDKLGNGKPVTDANVLEVINNGGATMPPMGAALSDEDKANIIAYLKTQQ
jgi:cytochrome c